MVSQAQPIDVSPWRAQHFVGGHPALDLVNTISHRLDPALAIDRVNKPAKIVSWAVEIDLLTKAGASQLKPDGLVDGIAQLRTAAAAIFDAAVKDRAPPPASLASILNLAGDGAAELVDVPDHVAATAKVRPTRLDVSGFIAALALLVLDGVFRLQRRRVRACPRCGWLFYDASKSGRRRWCSMKVCGNREKVSRHYRTRRDIQGTVKEGDLT